jgi:undecaprenyl-diphosphatase
MTKNSLRWHRISQLDLALCLRLNRVSHFRPWRELFRVVSRLGNGVFWYTLIALLPIAHRADALPILGLHYPSDVLAGALLGDLVARIALSI